MIVCILYLTCTILLQATVFESVFYSLHTVAALSEVSLNFIFSIEQEAQRATYRAPEYNVPPFWRIGQGSHLVFLIGQKPQTW